MIELFCSCCGSREGNLVVTLSTTTASIAVDQQQQGQMGRALPPLAAAALCDQDHHWENHPILCQMLQQLSLDPQAMANSLYQHALENELLIGHSWLSLPPSPEEEEKDESSSNQMEYMQWMQKRQEQQQQQPLDEFKPLAQKSQQQRLLRIQHHHQHQQRQGQPQQNGQQQLPVVFAHGMGDSCFNSGMQHVVEWTSQLLNGTYVVCIPTGSNQAEDTNNGYFLSMNANVDVFAQAIAQDEKLKGGFHAIGFSQGCNVIRGYIEFHNTPTVHSFLSVNGVNAGEGAVPHCRPNNSQRHENHKNKNILGIFSNTLSVCELLMEQASLAAYTEFAQRHSFQANYWRDPRPSMFPKYQAYAQLAVWNGEATPDNPNHFLREETLGTGRNYDKNNDKNNNNNNNGRSITDKNMKTRPNNWNKTSQFVWILATQDTMVLPREGEHWAAPNPLDPFGPVLPMEQTSWYQQDLFGLRTAQEVGKNHWESFDGDHLKFSKADFERWVKTYLKQ